MGDEGPTPEIRVGDDERRAVDTGLQRAHAEGRITLMEYDERSERCWKARTRADLDALTRDLPAPATAESPPGHPAGTGRSPRSRVTGAIGTVAVLAVLGYAAAQVLTAADGRAVLGDTTITATPGQATVRVGMLLGDVTVVVPDGAHVVTTGMILAGDVTCALACAPAPPGVPPLVVDASGALGDLHVLTATRFAALPAVPRDPGDG